MNCEEVRRRAPLYLSGEMEGEELRLFHAHLETCGACAAEIADRWKLDGRIRAALEGDPLSADRVEREVRRRMAAAGWRRRGAIAAAALAAACAGVWLLRPVTSQSYADAARDHRMEVVEQQPRHWRYGAEIESIAAANGIAPVRIEGLAPARYILERAKICRIGGLRMLHLVYTSGRRRYSVYVCPHQASAGALRTFRSGEEQVSGMETGSFRVLVAADGGAAAEGAALARSAVRQLESPAGSG